MTMYFISAIFSNSLMRKHHFCTCVTVGPCPASWATASVISIRVWIAICACASVQARVCRTVVDFYKQKQSLTVDHPSSRKLYSLNANR